MVAHQGEEADGADACMGRGEERFVTTGEPLSLCRSCHRLIYRRTYNEWKYPTSVTSGLGLIRLCAGKKEDGPNKQYPGTFSIYNRKVMAYFAYFPSSFY